LGKIKIDIFNERIIGRQQLTLNYTLIPESNSYILAHFIYFAYTVHCTVYTIMSRVLIFVYFVCSDEKLEKI